MDDSRTALELIVRTGDPSLFDAFAERDGIDLNKILGEDKRIETLLYGVINDKHDFLKPDGRTSIPLAIEYLQRDQFKGYFDSVDNAHLLQKLVDFFNFHADSGNYKAVDLLSVDAMCNSIRRNLGNEKLKGSMTTFIELSYLAVASYKSEELRENGDHYFSLLSKWSNLINPRKIAKQIIERTDIIGSDGGCSNFYFVLNKLIGLTDKETVSQLVYEKCMLQEATLFERGYNLALKSGLIDDVRSKGEHINNGILRAVNRYEDGAIYTTELAIQVGTNAGVYIAGKFGTWLLDGKYDELVWPILNYAPGLIDRDTARASLTNAVAEILEKGDLDKLNPFLNHKRAYMDGNVVKLETIPFPSDLIDLSDLRVEPLALAYWVTQKVLQPS